MRAGPWTAAVVLALTVAGGGGARLSAQRFAVAGQVRDRAGSPIPDAEVAAIEHDTATRLVRSDSAGDFLLARLPRGELTLRVRRLGYQPRDIDVHVADVGTPASIVITLDEAAASLDAMAVNGLADEPDTRLRDFYMRKSTNSFGHFIDAAAIGKRRPQYLSEMLRTVPGVRVSPSRRIGNNVNIRGCAPLVWVDGVRIPGAQLDDVVQPTDVAAVEVYESFAGVPAQFFDRTATCGTILIWSRAR